MQARTAWASSVEPVAGGGVGAGGPNLWTVYVHLPEILGPLRQLHEQTHVNPRISQKLVHLVILITARHWANDIWTAHDVDIVKEGTAAETVKAIAEGRHPDRMSEDESIVYDFCTELLENKRVSDATYARAVAMFGEEGVVQIAVVQGLYSYLSMAVNMAYPESAPWAPVAVPAVNTGESHMTRRILPMALAAWLASCPSVGAQERLGPIPPEKMTPAQKQAVEEFTKTRRNGPFGFWWGYLRVPEVMIPFLQIQTHIHGVMETEKGALGEKLTHFAMLIAAREWTQQVIWDLHDKNAIKAGLKPETLSVLAAGRRPPMSEDETIVYDFCIELQRNRSVSDETYARMQSRFGERGVAEATLIQGEYTIMSMFMNVARTPLDPKTPPPLKPFPR